MLYIGFVLVNRSSVSNRGYTQISACVNIVGSQGD
jgi:hypothetical protein